MLAGPLRSVPTRICLYFPRQAVGSSWDVRVVDAAQCAAFLGGGNFVGGASGRPRNTSGLCARFGGVLAARPGCSVLCAQAMLEVWADRPPCSGDAQCPAPQVMTRRRFCCGYLGQVVAAGCSGTDQFRVAALDANFGSDGLRAFNLTDLCGYESSCVSLSTAGRQARGVTMAAVIVLALILAHVVIWLR
jgi:hypothetical protein